VDVYRVALEFHALAGTMALGKRARELEAQLDRASTSIVLNIAESTGRRGLADRARFLAMARGSATECAAILDIVRARRLAPDAAMNEGRTLLIRIVQMLTRWCQRLESAGSDL
jgi:four helix bundle protein